ncbi:hypothetical protein DQT32_04235 [Salmonella enterica subsp. enterica serovar Braenderup]|nr:hypothetical protein [Salmonella enterica subsp. enterica serovar Braenderup]
MNELLASINTIIWLIIAFVLIIGHLTCADYYHNMDKHFRATFWIAFAIASFFGGMMFIVAGSNDGLAQGWKWASGTFTCFTLAFYAAIVALGVCVAYSEAHQYFKHKRGRV